MPERARPASLIAAAAVGTALALGGLWALVAPLLLGLPDALLWRNAQVALPATGLAVLLMGLANVLLRWVWPRRRAAELPIRLLVTSVVGSGVALAVAWSVALARWPQPHGRALLLADLGLTALVALVLLLVGRTLLRTGPAGLATSPGVPGDRPVATERRRPWSRVGLRGYLVLTATLLGSGAALLVEAYALMNVHREAVARGRQGAGALAALVARRLDAVPRERLDAALGQLELPPGYRVRLRPPPADGSGPEGAGAPCAGEVPGTIACRFQRLGPLHEGQVIEVRARAGQAGPSPPESRLRLLFALAWLLLGAVIAHLMGRDAADDLDEVARRIRGIAADPEAALFDPLAATSRDEVGELVHQFGALRRRLAREVAHGRERVALSTAADQRQTEFLVEVSHALREPLTAIIGFSELLMEPRTGLSPAQVGDVQIVRDASRQLHGLVRDLLDVSVMDAGHPVALRLAPTSLGDLVSAEVAVARAALQPGVVLREEVAPDLPDAMLDPLRLRRALGNLLSNAVKFTEAGEVVVRVGRGEEGFLRVAVSDTGPGIPADDLPYLFEQYRQGRQERRRRFKGSGLGLAITRQIVLLHEGRVHAESGVGHGSTFTVELPLAGPRRAEAGPAPAAGGPA
jgi:signal transduction histidine kinase